MSALERIAARIDALNPLHSKKIRRNLKGKDSSFHERATNFFDHYEKWLIDDGLSLDYAVDCYLKMLADMNFESVQFLRDGKYSSQSFEEVNQRVYNNPDVMDYYMHGLLLSQFLWSHHYDILINFSQTLAGSTGKVENYLEIGGGHGLYISEAIDVLGNSTSFDLVDISESSLAISKKMIRDNDVNFIHSDIFEYETESRYDWITMGEVLEHVEEPVGLLERLQYLLSDNGRIYITTPTNAPAIDHIYLFRNADDVREVIANAGLIVEEEHCLYTEEGVDEEFAEKHKIPMMYVGLLKAH